MWDCATYLLKCLGSCSFSFFHEAPSVFREVSPATVIELVVNPRSWSDPFASCASFSGAPVAVGAMHPIVLDREV